MCEAHHASGVDNDSVPLVQSSKCCNVQHSDRVCAKQGREDVYVLGKVQKTSNRRSSWPRRIPPFLPLGGSEKQYFRDHKKKTDDFQMEEGHVSYPLRKEVGRTHNREHPDHGPLQLCPQTTCYQRYNKASNIDFSVLSRSNFPPSMAARRRMATRSSCCTRKKQSSLVIIDSVLFDILDANDDPIAEWKDDDLCFSC